MLKVTWVPTSIARVQVIPRPARTSRPFSDSPSWRFNDSRAGARPAATAVKSVITLMNVTTLQSERIAVAEKKPPGQNDAPGGMKEIIARLTTAAMLASSTFSTRSIRTSPSRLPPTARRMAISRCRFTARDRSRVATAAQTISVTSIGNASAVENIHNVSAGAIDQNDPSVNFSPTTKSESAGGSRLVRTRNSAAAARRE